MLVDLLTVVQMILVGPLVIICLFLVLPLVPYISFLLLLCGFKPGYYALFVGNLWWYQCMLVTYPYLCVYILSILYLCANLLHRSFHFGLGMITTSHIHCVYLSIFLVSVVSCLLLS